MSLLLGLFCLSQNQGKLSISSSAVAQLIPIHNITGLETSRFSPCGLLTVDPFSFRVMDLELRFEQILHHQFSVTSGLVVSCGENKAMNCDVQKRHQYVG